MPGRAAVPRVLRLRRRGARGTTLLGELWRLHDDLPARARSRGSSASRRQQLKRQRARRLREGRRVPAARARAPAPGDPARSRDAQVPGRRLIRPPARASRVELLEDALRNAVGRRSPPRCRHELGGGCVTLGRSSSTSTTSAQGRRARRGRAATWPSTRPRATEQAGGRAAPRRPPTRSTSVPVREHVRDYLRAAFDARRHRQATRADAAPTRRRRRSTSRPTGTRPRSRSACSARWAPTRRCACACTTAPPTSAASCGCSPTRPSAATPRSWSSSTPALACTWPTSPRSAPRTGRLAAAIDATRGSPRCAHAFGYRGHCLTKSRRYSTTFKAAARRRARPTCTSRSSPAPPTRPSARSPRREHAHRGVRVRRRRARNSR